MSDQVDQSKKSLRKKMRGIRKALSAADRAAIDHALAVAVQSLPAWQSAACVMPYLSFGEEADTRELIAAAWQQGKAVALPRCVPNSRDMRWFAVTTLDNLERSSFGVDEPRIDPANEVDPRTVESAIALVPGLTFDEKGFRLGYGGGFYDSFLSDFSGTSIGLCRDVQLSEDLASLGVIDPHDLAVDLVVTDSRVIDPRQ